MATLTNPTVEKTGDGSITATVTSDVAGEDLFFSVRQGGSWTQYNSELIKRNVFDVYRETKTSAFGVNTFTVTGLNPTEHAVGFVQTPKSAIDTSTAIDFYADLAGMTFTRLNDQIAESQSGELVLRDANLPVYPKGDWSGSAWSNSSGECEGILLEENSWERVEWTANLNDADTGGYWGNHANATITADADPLQNGTLATKPATYSNSTLSRNPIRSGISTKYTITVELRAGGAGANDDKASLRMFIDGADVPNNARILHGPGSLVQSSNIPDVSGLSQTEWTRVAITPTAVPSSATIGFILYPGFSTQNVASVIQIRNVNCSEGETPAGRTYRTDSDSRAIRPTTLEGLLSAISVDTSTTVFTAWVKFRPQWLSTDLETTKYIMTVSDSGGTNNLFVRLDGANAEAGKTVAGAETEITSAATYNYNQAITVAVRVSPSGVKAWLNGTSIGTDADTAPFTTAIDRVSFGAGVISEARFDNTALDDSIVESWG